MKGDENQMAKLDEKQIETCMKNLGLTREEAIEMLEEDACIDRGEKLYELDPELEAGAKKARQAERKATTTKREKKPKPEKAEICTAMMEGLTTALGVGEFNVTNPEREFIFIHNGTKYKVTLACPRS